MMDFELSSWMVWPTSLEQYYSVGPGFEKGALLFQKGEERNGDYQVCHNTEAVFQSIHNGNLLQLSYIMTSGVFGRLIT